MHSVVFLMVTEKILKERPILSAIVTVYVSDQCGFNLIGSMSETSRLSSGSAFSLSPSETQTVTCAGRKHPTAKAPFIPSLSPGLFFPAIIRKQKENIAEPNSQNFTVWQWFPFSFRVQCCSLVFLLWWIMQVSEL